jgi:hypothetical protein
VGARLPGHYSARPSYSLVYVFLVSAVRRAAVFESVQKLTSGKQAGFKTRITAYTRSPATQRTRTRHTTPRNLSNAKHLLWAPARTAHQSSAQPDAESQFREPDVGFSGHESDGASHAQPHTTRQRPMYHYHVSRQAKDRREIRSLYRSLGQRAGGIGQALCHERMQNEDT